MQAIGKEEQLFKYRILYNGYPIVNEFSQGAFPLPFPVDKYSKESVYYDDYYGRFFTGDFLNNMAMVYGGMLVDYDPGADIKLTRVDSLRVPYRLIPVFKANNLQEIEHAVSQMKRHSPQNTFLYRGQGKIYTIDRTEEEKMELYGCFMPVKEPSFLPSFRRAKLDYDKAVSSWHNVCAFLTEELMKTHRDVFLDFRQRELFHLLALGLAQHYGLPSVGLDLTDDLKVALWFAIYKATYSNKEPVKAELIKDEDNEATIFVFRCHPRSVFRYSDLVQGIGAHRPDAQSAYFNYCGWGLAKNQLALDLACAFRVDASFAKELPENYIEHLFPKKEDDEVLRILLQIKDMYQGTELGEMMEKIYL